MTARRTRLLLAAIVVGALALRVAYVLLLQRSPAFDDPQMDALYHVEWGRARAAGVDHLPGPFFRAPLYPWFLALCFTVFGDGLLAPRLVQCLFGAATTALAFAVGRRAFDARVGLAAAALVATNWVLVYFDGELLIPTLIAPLDLLALWLTLGLATDARPRRALAAGLAWGLAVVARPNPLVFVPLLVGWLVLRAPRGARGARLGAAAALLAGVALPVLPITAYNLAQGDRVLISSQAGVNLWIGNNPASDGSTAIVPGTRSDWWGGFHDAVALAEAAEGRPLRPSEVSRHYVRRTLDHVRAEPAAALRHLAWKARLLLLDWELGNNQDARFVAWRYGGPVRFLPPGFGVVGGFSVLLGLAVAGLLLAGPGRAERFPLWGFLGVYAATIVAFFVCGRFRAPLLPVLSVYAGAALVRLVDAARARRPGPLLALVPAALVAAFSLAIPDRVDTSDANGHLQLSVAAARAGRLLEALEHARGAVDANPRSRIAARQLGTLLVRIGARDEGLPWLRTAVRLGPGDAESWIELSAALEPVDPSEALAAAEEAARLSPGASRAHYQLGRARFALRDLAGAAQAFDEALRIDPGSFHAAFSLGAARHALGEPDAALAAWLRAIDLAEAGEPAFVAQARDAAIALLRQAGREGEARALEQRRAWE